MTPLGLARHLIAVIGGRQPKSRMRSYSGREVSVTSAEALAIRIDSEDGRGRPSRSASAQGALKVLAASATT